MSTSVEAEVHGQPMPGSGFEVRTVRCDASRADVRVSGRLDAGGALVLASVIDAHVRARRRFLRLHIGGVRELSDAALTVLTDAHRSLLGRRGTLILTGVTPALEDQLRAASAANPVLMIRPTAAERLG